MKQENKKIFWKGAVIGEIIGLVIGLLQLVFYVPSYSPSYAPPLYNIFGKGLIFLGILLPPFLFFGLIGFLVAVLSRKSIILAGAVLGLIYAIFPFITPLIFFGFGIAPPPEMGGIYLLLIMPHLLLLDVFSGGQLVLFSSVILLIMFSTIGALIGFIIEKVKKK